MWEETAIIEHRAPQVWPYQTETCSQCGLHRNEHEWTEGPDLFLWPGCPRCEECGQSLAEHFNGCYFDDKDDV